MEKRGSNARLIGPMSLAVSAELRAELARQGFNVQSFARHSNLPVSTLHKTLKGKRVVDVEDLFAICDALGVEPGPVVDRASSEALRQYAHGILPGSEDAEENDGATNVVRLDDHRLMPVDDERAVASERTEDDGSDEHFDD
mgnify:CR=1 FL=1